MGSACEDLLPKVILQLGQSLDLIPCKTAWNFKEVAGLCDHVAPDMDGLLMALSEVGASTLLGVLPMLLNLKIPANLVKLMTISLRAGYPVAQPSAAAKEFSEIAFNMWELAAALFSKLLVVCYTHPGQPNYELCKAEVEQLQPLTSDGEPGAKLYLLEPPCNRTFLVC